MSEDGFGSNCIIKKIGQPAENNGLTISGVGEPQEDKIVIYTINMVLVNGTGHSNTHSLNMRYHQ